jgi:integrase/recombinase XerD
LKLNNDVNSNIAEKLMAHKRGLDGTYLQPTREQCFAEFVKAIPDLTIDQTERQKAIIKIKNKQIDELQSTKEENILQQDAIKRLEQAVDLLLKKEESKQIAN